MSQNQQDMAGKRQTWWQRNKRLLMIIGVVILVLLIAFALTVYLFGWNWTGFTSETGPTLQPNEQYRPTKTLWDVLQLLIIPIMLAIGGFWLNRIQKDRELRNTIQQAELEREIAYYNQQETTLQSYLDRMSELLLKENLRTSNPNDEVRNIARVRTLTALCQLEANRNSYIFEFLRESKLISKDMSKSILDLSRADLGGVRLSEVNLSGSNLSGINFTKADLSKANLCEVDLSNTNLNEANLKDCAGITAEELEKQARSLRGAIMPDGSVQP